MEPTQLLLERVRSLYESGLSLQAHTLATTEAGPIAQWRGTEARILAGRMAANLGGRRLSLKLHLTAWRAERANPEALCAAAHTLFERRGPLYAWRWMQRRWNPLDPAVEHAEWLSHAAMALGELRDFERAHQLLDRAQREGSDKPWFHTLRASLLENEDRYDEAMEAAETGLELHPWHRPSVQVKAHLLTIRGSDDEALALLTEAEKHLESASLSAQRAHALLHRRDWTGLEEAIARSEALAPLAEKEFSQWIAGMRGEVAYHRGDENAAKVAFEQAGSFYVRLAEKLAAAGETPARRVELPVGFVRQHHVTCAPATLTALSRYWDRQAEHLSVVEEICYDGTSGHSERRWAETHDFVAREFTLTFEAARNLLDRGVPFTLATVGLDMGHLQAVIGYDARRGTLLIRDPYYPTTAEGLAEELIESHASTGPRGHVFVPAERASLLDGLDLPDASLWDRHHRLLQALEEHRRSDARAECDALISEAPEHRLTLSGRRALAAYDGNTSELLKAIDGLIGLYPNDAHLLAARLSCLSELSRPKEHEAELKRLADSPDQPGRALFARQYARTLLPDARRHAEARERLARLLRKNPGDADALHAEGTIWWSRRRLSEALESFRLAACLEDKSEFCANSFAQTLRAQGRGEEALRFLRARNETLGARSSMPTRSLFSALWEIGRVAEALAVLDSALRRRPDDGELLLYAAHEKAKFGRFDEADALMERAIPLSSEAHRLHTRAAIAFYRGDRREEATIARQLVENTPLNTDAHHALARALAAAEGHEAVDAHFVAFQERFPNHLGLRRARIEWLREGSDARLLETALDELLALQPTDAWARRERALLLQRIGRPDEALAETVEACRLQSADPASHVIRGYVLRESGRDAEALQAYGLGLQLDADQPAALKGLLASAPNREERRRLLAWFEKELVRQPSPNNGLLVFADVALGPLHPDEILAALTRVREARPDLWQAASALISFQTERGNLAEALAGARAATESFPLISRLLLDLADVHIAQGEVEAALETLATVRERHPGDASALHRRRRLLVQLGRVADAQRELEHAIESNPLDAELHQSLASLLYTQGRKEEALARLRVAIERDPHDTGSWEKLKEWSAAMGRRNATAEQVKTLTERYPDDASLHLAAAHALPGDALDDRLRLVERALALRPRSAPIHDFKAELLALARRFDEAKAACAPRVFSTPPQILQGRAAWIESLQGNLPDACKKMRAALAGDSSYLWGWSRLAEWHYDLGEAPQTAEAARWMTRLNPGDATGWGYLADSQLKLKDRRGAKATLGEALRRSPDYEYAALRKMDLHLEDGELNLAEETLGMASSAVASSPAPLRMAIQIAEKRKDRMRALSRFEQLVDAALQREETYMIRQAIQDLTDPDWQDDALSHLGTFVTQPEAPAAAGMEWAYGMAIRGRGEETLASLPKLSGGVAAQRMAAAQTIALCAEAGRADQTRALLKQYGPMLRRPAKSWGMLAHALHELADWKGVVAWTDDWRTYPDIEAWILFNRIEALRCLGRTTEAAEASRFALALPPDYTTAWHALCLAFDAALGGDDPGPLLADFEFSPERLPPFPRQLLLYTHAMSIASRDFGAAKTLWGQGKAAWPQAANQSGTRGWAMAVGARIAKNAGGTAAWLWAQTVAR